MELVRREAWTGRREAMQEEEQENSEDHNEEAEKEKEEEEKEEKLEEEEDEDWDLRDLESVWNDNDDEDVEDDDINDETNPLKQRFQMDLTDLVEGGNRAKASQRGTCLIANGMIRSLRKFGIQIPRWVILSKSTVAKAQKHYFASLADKVGPETYAVALDGGIAPTLQHEEFGATDNENNNNNNNNNNNKNNNNNNNNTNNNNNKRHRNVVKNSDHYAVCDAVT